MRMKPLSYNGPIMSFLSKMVDLVVLNLLALIFSIPMITIGTAMTAVHFTALKIHRGEGHVCRCFFQSFKQSLKQSTCIWLIFLSYVSISVIFYNIAMQIGGMKGTGIWLLFGVSVPIYWCVMVYDKIFEKLEEMVKQNTI